MPEYVADIYALYSGRDGVVRYVGETVHTSAQRFKGHIQNGSTTWSLRRWFHSEWEAGYPIECVRLEECDYYARYEQETLWMQKFPASNLLNERKVYPSSHARTAAKIDEITDYMRRYRCNTGGKRGIRYDQYWDCYQVLTYNGRPAEWLFGDGIADEMMPGWGGNMYFPDRTRALIARDRERRWNPTRMLPDFVEPEF